jgi:hypothetical protein
MQKRLSTLALQVVERQQILHLAVVRLQHGFMRPENTLMASKQIHAITAILREIEESLHIAMPDKAVHPVK